MSFPKINGFIKTPEQSLSGAMQMYTISTATDIVTLTNGHNAVLDKLIEAISTRAQPVLLGAPAGSGPYTLRFAVEHSDAFGATLTAMQTLIRGADVLNDNAATLVAFAF